MGFFIEINIIKSYLYTRYRIRNVKKIRIMACNCKKQLDHINEKYGDGGKDSDKVNPFMKVIEFIAQIVFGIFCGAIIIVMIIPMLIYIIFCIMFGRQASFRIKHLNKFWKKDE